MNRVLSILQGGLGNYMFQVAVAYAYGKRYDKEPVFNAEQSTGPHQHVSTYSNNIFKNLILDGYVKPGKPGLKRYNEIDYGFHYNPINKYDNSVILNGYFQSEKYFKDCEDEIREMFMSYDIEMSDKVKELLEGDNTCSIHVRRGDYLKSPDHHPTQSMNYYMKAIKKMPKDSKFLIFSDDIAWCKENFPDMPEKFVFIEGNKDYEDLYIMSKCKNNIICNSTFSWWAAWLNNSADKSIVAPSTWFGPAYASWNTDDLYCEGWIKI